MLIGSVLGAKRYSLLALMSLLAASVGAVPLREMVVTSLLVAMTGELLSLLLLSWLGVFSMLLLALLEFNANGVKELLLSQGCVAGVGGLGSFIG